MKIIFVVIAIFATSVGFCETACKVQKWTKNRNLSLKTFKQTLDAAPRSEIIQTAWSEIIENSQNSVALPLLHYLSSTEQDSLLRGYYKAMGSMVTTGLTPEEGVRDWPKRPTSRKSLYSLAQLCELYKKSGGK